VLLVCGSLTASQVFEVGDPDAPGSCRQRRGQEEVWEPHQASVEYVLALYFV
jgi:hypothetical protein